ncbi:MAG TPA: PhzF family phenazine biosynthesis isomerase [Puia sp.]|jgi:PhzF family phenazine biosynthesis protein|nr:PhzF family phenazine biosynthesis isomerase [Puia sp.]
MKIYQVDAFAKSLFQGNPAAIVPLEKWLPDTLMQQIAMENNLAETAFLVEEGKDFQIRWFTPSTEVDLCGHATLASAFVLYHYRDYKEDVIRFHSRSGLLTVTRQGESLSLDFPADTLTEVELSPDLTIGLDPRPIKAFKGKTDYMLVFEREQDIRDLRVDLTELSRIRARGIIVTAPGEKVDMVSRFFAPQSGIDEDPVTGSAHTTLTPYWAARLGKTKLTAIQLSARKGWLECELKDDRVLITGQARPFLKGDILLDQAGQPNDPNQSNHPNQNDQLDHPNQSPQPASLTITDAQQLVDKWIRTVGVRYFSELTNMAILTEEVGEVARLMSRLYGDQSFRPSDKDRNLSDELADVLWVLICIANQTGVDLTAALLANFAKKQSRDSTRHQTNAKLT